MRASIIEALQKYGFNTMTPEKERLVRFKARVRESGGKPVLVYLRGEDAAKLDSISRHLDVPGTEAVRTAIRALHATMGDESR
jgi:hypothetical protein